MRGAANDCKSYWFVRKYFNPRARAGRGPLNYTKYLLITNISIHAPRAGRGDPPKGCFVLCAISIHAPRVGRGKNPAISPTFIPYFNPRARVGRGQGHCTKYKAPKNFNPRARVGRGLIRQQVIS